MSAMVANLGTVGDRPRQRTSHSRSVDEVVEQLGTDHVRGLPESEAALRLATCLTISRGL